MRPIVNMTEEDRATDIGNMHKKFGKDRACGSRDTLADKQTVGWLVGWGLTALLTQNRSYRACRFVGIFYSKL